jgi:hypothetical protein
MPNRSPANIVLADLIDFDRRHYPGENALTLEGVLHRKPIHNRGKHAHMIGANPIHPGFGKPSAAKNIAATNHQRHFDTAVNERMHFSRQATQHIRVYSVLGLAKQRLAAELKQNALIDRLCHRLYLNCP